MSLPAVGHESEASFSSLYEQCILALGLEINGEIRRLCMLLSPQSDYQSPSIYALKLDNEIMYLDPDCTH